MIRSARYTTMLTCVLAAFCARAAAEPTIPKETIDPKIPRKVRMWMERLYWTSEHDRARACVRLTELKEEAHPAIPYLVAILGDTPKVREAASTALAFMGAPSVGPLLGALNSEDAVARETAAETLIRMGPIAAPGIASQLRSPDPKTREIAVDLLLRVGPSGTDQMIALLSDPDEALRNYVALKLKIGGKFTEAAMTEALSSKDHRVRQGAVRGLAIIGGPESVKPLIKALDDRDAWIREQAALALGDLGDAQAVKPLIAKANDRRAGVQAAVAASLGKLGDPSATKALTFLAEDRDTRVRTVALEALGRMKDPSLVKPMGKLLKDDALDRHVRAAAAKGIALLGGEEAAELLAEAVTDRDGYVRMKVIEALGVLGDAGVEPLAGQLADRQVAHFAIAALGETHSPAAMAPLEKLLEAAGPETRHAVFSAMAKLGEPGFRRIAAEWQKEIASPRPHNVTLFVLANALADAGGPALPLLLDALTKTESPARQEAADAVRYNFNDRKAVRMLVEAMTEKDDPFVNDALGAALTRITGVPMAARRADWQTWWENNKAAWLLKYPEPPPPAGGPRK